MDILEAMLSSRKRDKYKRSYMPPYIQGLINENNPERIVFAALVLDKYICGTRPDHIACENSKIKTVPKLIKSIYKRMIHKPTTTQQHHFTQLFKVGMELYRVTGNKTYEMFNVEAIPDYDTFTSSGYKCLDPLLAVVPYILLNEYNTSEYGFMLCEAADDILKSYIRNGFYSTSCDKHTTINVGNICSVYHGVNDYLRDWNDLKLYYKRKDESVALF